MGKSTKAYKGVAMEGPIASWYAKLTRNDQNRHKGMAERMSRKIAPASRVLEIAPGPGYFSIELARLGNYEITGLDISRTFVEIARKNAEAADVKVDFRLGNASDMPFTDGTFDFIFCQAAFKNFTQPVEAISEMYRVLRPQGRAVISDLRRDTSLQDIEREIKNMGVNRINEWFTKQSFKWMLLKNAYTTNEMEAFAAQTPFGRCNVEVDGVGFQVWLEK
jgi:ubiquinone/menaquinone biosynthesis C-methylase UbiE